MRFTTMGVIGFSRKMLNFIQERWSKTNITIIREEQDRLTIDYYYVFFLLGMLVRKNRYLRLECYVLAVK